VDRQILLLKNPKEFRIAHGAGLKDMIKAVSDMTVESEDDDLVFRVTGDKPLFLMIYDGKETLNIA